MSTALRESYILYTNTESALVIDTASIPFAQPRPAHFGFTGFIFMGLAVKALPQMAFLARTIVYGLQYRAEGGYHRATRQD